MFLSQGVDLIEKTIELKEESNYDRTNYKPIRGYIM